LTFVSAKHGIDDAAHVDPENPLPGKTFGNCAAEDGGARVLQETS
jgi:hypothetical protein